MQMNIREKKHRLEKEYYEGEVSATFTLCLKGNGQWFNNPNVVDLFTGILTAVGNKFHCIVPAYCFMPDHQHVILKGSNAHANILKAINQYKQKTGYWMLKNKPEMKWQKDFYDHIIRTEKEMITQIKYILENPVRKGLVSSWEEHPFNGSIGCDIDDIVNAL